MGSTVDNTEKIRRVAELHVGISAIQVDAMSFKRIVSMELDADEGFIIKGEDCTKPLRDQPLCDSTISEDWKHTFACINMCVTIIAWNIRWIVWLTEGKYLQSLTRSVLIGAGQDIYIEAMSFTQPKPHHKFRCHYIDADKSVTSEEYKHTVITLSPASDDGEVVSDASHAQYSFEQGIESLREYEKTKLWEESRTIPENLGKSVERMRNLKKTPGRRAREAIITPTVNNVVVEEVEQLGGPEKFLGLATKESEQARDRIFAKVKGALEALRLQLEDIYYSPVLNEAELENLKKQCDGQGNRECQASYGRSVEAAS
jgi:hypothetical protein